MNNNGILTVTDKRFLRHALMYFNIRMLKVDWSDSKAKHPDIWISPNGKPPEMSITAEWAGQRPHERRKRMVHELLHAVGLQHNDKIGYSTYPDKDKFAKRVYLDIIGGSRKYNAKRFGIC